ncbi:MAG: hypothetical protein ABI772_02800 [Bacteroidota bacterium]
MKHIGIYILLLVSISLQAQNVADDAVITKIEQQVAEIKKTASADFLKKNQVALSDIENRKNSLKMLLKRPAEKRDAEWQNKWNSNYKHINEKLEQLKKVK